MKLKKKSLKQINKFIAQAGEIFAKGWHTSQHGLRVNLKLLKIYEFVDKVNKLRC